MPLNNPMQAESITLESLELTRADVPLFSPVDLEAEAGDIWVIKGDNGSGKSTLLKAMAGLYPIAAGDIRYGDKRIRKHVDYPHCILFLGHKRALRLHMSVRDNVTHWARLYGTPELVDSALHYFDLEPYADMGCDALSAGWRERVALTRLITNPAPVWLLDEPLNHLDEEGISLAHSIITSRTEQKGIVFLTTHLNIMGDKPKTLNLSEVRG